MNYPLVTVFTTIYDTNPKFVIQAIESIRANNYPNLQHIIIDDCSTNLQFKETIKKWIFENNYLCEFIEHEVNFGLCKTLNHVLELAKGKYIFGCSDDIILPNKILTEVQVLESLDVQYALCYSDTELVDENGFSLNKKYIKDNFDGDYFPEGEIFEMLLDRNFIPPMSVLFKTSSLKEIGGFDENLGFEDIDILLRLSKRFKIKYIDVPLSKYRQHKSSLSRNYEKWNSDLLQIYKKHIDNKRVAYNFELYEKYNNLKKNKFSNVLNRLIYQPVGYNFIINDQNIFLFNSNFDWYESKNQIKKLRGNWRLPNIQELEKLSLEGILNDRIWSDTPGYGLYAWYFNIINKKSNYCLRDKKLRLIAIKNT